MLKTDELFILALRAGRYRDVATLLSSLDSSPESSVLRLEACYFLAQSERVRVDGERLLRVPNLQPILAARCARLIASQLCDDGRLEDGILAYRLALAKAEEAASEAEVCLARMHLLERTCDYSAFDASLPLAAQTRRAAVRCGDPQIRATVHNTFGRLEGRTGRFQVARKHFAIARELLQCSPNLRLSTAIDNDEATLLVLTCDYEAALRLVRRAGQSAREAGYAKGIVAAAYNEAYILVAQDRLDEAETQLRLAGQERFRSTTYDLAVSETRALIAYRVGQYELAEQILSASEPTLKSRGGWYELEADLTRVRLLLRLRRFADALECADSRLAKAKASGGLTQAISLSLAKIEAQIALGQNDVGIEGLLGLGQQSWPVTLLANFWTVLGKAFHSRGNRRRGEAYLWRAVRALEAAGAIAAALEAKCALSEVDPVAADEKAEPFDWDSLACLFDLADYPLSFGREVFDILGRCEFVSALALVATSDDGNRVICERPAGQGYLLAKAAQTDSVGMAIGVHDGETIRLIGCVRKAFEARHLVAAVSKFVAIANDLRRYRNEEKQRAALWPADAMDQDGDTVWASEQMSELLTIARRIATNPISVLLTGETGTGKELLAREIHRASERAERSFLPFNCSAVPRDMVESQLFGYRKGAFTGADASFPGVIRSAAGGTLFLDEIADVPLDLQPKLLRFLETREIHPLGEPQPITVDVRIVAATNANLEQLVAEGRFREDLFYRLNVMRLRLPPLRERREEIPALVQHYLRKFGDEQKKGQLTLADETLEYLLLYSWPGNVRQLANEVRRMVAISEPDSTLTPALLSPELQASRRTIAAAAPAPEPEIHLRLDQPLPVAVEILEQTMIRNALKRSRGRVEEAARLLGISRKGLFLKRRRWNLDQKAS